MLLRVRLLPLVIFVSVLMLLAKVGSIWQTVSDAAGSARAASEVGLGTESSGEILVVAQGAGEQQVSGGGPVPRELTQQAASPGFPEPVTLDPQAPGAGRFLKPADVIRGEDVDSEDLQNLTKGELRLLYSLADRRRKIIERERELIERESLLRAVEQQLESKQKRLSDIENSIQELLARYDRRKDEENVRLRMIYTNMRPKSAAAIFDRLETETLVGVLQGMEPRVVAPIVAEMNVDRARELTRLLAERRTFDDLALTSGAQAALPQPAASAVN